MRSPDRREELRYENKSVSHSQKFCAIAIKGGRNHAQKSYPPPSSAAALPISAFDDAYKACEPGVGSAFVSPHFSALSLAQEQSSLKL